MNLAHQGSILPIKNIPVPLDNNTHTYMNFNRNLVGAINPTYPTIQNFNLNNNTPISQDHYEDIATIGKHGRGIIIDEYTENTAATTYAAYNNYKVPATLAKLTETYQGSDIYRLTMTVDDAHSTSLSNFRTALSSHGIYGFSQNFLANTQYVFSVLYRPVTHTDIRVGGTASNISGWREIPPAYYRDGWYRVGQYRDGSVAVDKSDNIFTSFYCPSLELNVPISIDFCCPQKEVGKIYPTSYAIGTRRPTYLTYNINTNPRTISFWFKSTANKTPSIGSDRTLLLLGNDAGSESTPYLQCYITGSYTFNTASNKIGLCARVGATNYYCQVDIDANDGNWHFVTIEINDVSRTGVTNKVCRLWVDGINAETKDGLTTAGYAETIFGSVLRLGHSFIPSSASENNTAIANAIFDNLCIRTDVYSEDEVIQWYHSNREFYNPYDYSLTV